MFLLLLRRRLLGRAGAERVEWALSLHLALHRLLHAHHRLLLLHRHSSHHRVGLTVLLHWLLHLHSAHGLLPGLEVLLLHAHGHLLLHLHSRRRHRLAAVL